MLKAVRNLNPKYKRYSPICSHIQDIIHETLENPVKIPNYMGTHDDIIKTQRSSYNIKKNICEYNLVDNNGINNYFNNYKKSKSQWEKYSFNDKKDIFLKTADLIENKYYDKMLAYTILGQNKTIYEAEIDAICELVDFLRFNVYYAEEIMKKQPIQTRDIMNISEYNSLNGFVASITPFNFTAIGGNLASAPLLFGNSVLWKPSDNAMLSNHLFYEIMIEAGLPEGVLNFCPMEPNMFLQRVTDQPDLSLALFTGSSNVLDKIYYNIGKNISQYNNYPRIVGESGGKNYHFIGPYNDKVLRNLIDAVLKTVHSSFDYSGQKCSACSIVYVPEKYLESFIKKVKGAVLTYNKIKSNYGVINNKSFEKLKSIINHLKDEEEIEFICDGDITTENNSYYVGPHVLLCRNHDKILFDKEFFGPILAIYPYKDLDDAMDKCLNTNNYALTGAIFSDDETFIKKATREMAPKTGNFYINDKSTGSVVGQQPFGGSGKSGTNDKAGDMNLLYRMFNQRNIKMLKKSY